MSKQQINPYLMLRLNTVIAAFNDLATGGDLNRYSSVVATAPRNNWDTIIQKDEDSGSDDGGGGGTMRGHRAKNAEHMKRLTRRR